MGTEVAVVGRRSWRQRASEQRCERLVRAMAALVCELGFANVSVTMLCAKAGVSRPSFYELFESRETCFLAVLDHGHRHASACISQAFQQAEDWLEGGRKALAALLQLFEAEPELARVCVVDSLAAGPWALERRELHAAAITRVILEHCGEEAPAEPHRFAHAATMASLLVVLQAHLLQGRREPLVSLLGPLTALATSPYLESAASARQVKLADAAAKALLIGRENVLRDSFTRREALPGVLANPRAHRARDCVRYLLAHPGASNRQISRAVGIESHAQISTLLARLADYGLLLKRPGLPGHANEWCLTPHGQQSAQALARTSRARAHGAGFYTRPPPTTS